ncbi:MAG: histidine kinase [Nitrososphaerota archaeon]
MIDTVDDVILSALSKDAKQDIHEIWDYLRESGYELTIDDIECRIKTLEDDGAISHYTIAVNSNKIKHRIIRVALVTFRNSQHLPSRLDGLKKYLADAPFVLYSGKTRGGYDWICVQVFPSENIADQESDIYRNLFGDIIQTYETYDLLPLKEPSLHALTYTNKEYKRFLDEWIPPFLGK